MSAEEKRKGEVIFKRDLELHRCGYRSVCPIELCVNCCLNIDKKKYNYEVWEEMRKGIEGKYSAFWKGDKI